MVKKTIGHSLDETNAIKKSIVTVKSALSCLAYALIIVLAGVSCDPKYQSYRHGYGLKTPVEDLLNDLYDGGVIEEFWQVQDQISDYQIIVFNGLNADKVMISGNSRSAKKLHLVYNRDNEHCNVIINLKGAMAKQYICNGCDTLYNKTHPCDVVCSLCTDTPPCTKDQTKYCRICKRQFLSEKYFQNYLTLKWKGKLICQWRQVCRKCR